MIRPNLFQKVAESEATCPRKQRLREDRDSGPISSGPFRDEGPNVHTWGAQRHGRKEVRGLRGIDSVGQGREAGSA